MGSCKVDDICNALHEVCQLEYIKGRVRVVYYDNVTSKTAQAIKRATGAGHVLQDIWHICNRINSSCNNRVGGTLYEEHVKDVSACFFQWKKSILHGVKKKLWNWQITSYINLPDGRRVNFKDLSDLDIFTHLMRPAQWEPGCGWMPNPSADPAGLDAALERLLPTAKFFETFAKNLQKEVRPKKEIRASLIAVYWKYLSAIPSPFAKLVL